MSQDTVIFTECFNCEPIAAVMLKSFVKHHPNTKIHVFGSRNDLMKLMSSLSFMHDGDHDFFDRMHRNIQKEEMSGVEHLFQQGHRGTAFVFATAFEKWKGKKIIHIDSDIYFKQESISLIENAFTAGYDIIGSRRCYKNNPGGAVGFDDIPDSMSTYFLGINTEKTPSYSFENLCMMFQGTWHPWGYRILDFGDPVIHATMHNGGKVLYLDQNLIGGQDENGKKVSQFKSNMHLDMGSHLAHFGGVGSGYAINCGLSSPEPSYAEWAKCRYAFWSKLFYNTDDEQFKDMPPQFDASGRWVNGGWNDELLNLIAIESGLLSQ